MGDNLSLKDAFVVAVFAGDKDKLRSLAAPDFELRQNRALPYGGVYRGADGFLSFLDKFVATYEIDRLENTRTFTGPGGSVATEFAFKGKVRSSGRAFDTTMIELWEFSANQITRITVY